jgi:coenzyme F420-0:L-glutamate ligase/coenzyme F420-1:gamma-L-glutamate ligase
LQIIPVTINKEILPGDDIVELLINSFKIQENDIVIIAQKIISKQEGRIVELNSIKPSLLSNGIGSQYCKDPRIIELILNESKRIVRMNNGIIIVENNNGFICANAGIDESNVEEGFVTLLPLDSDKSANSIKSEIFSKSKKHVGVIISDTFGRPFRMGQTNCAIGIAGINPIIDYAGIKDTHNRTLRITAIAIADEISSAAELVMEKATNTPIAILRDFAFDKNSHSISEMIRPENEDLFR